MDSQITYSKTDEQIEKLKSQGLIIDDPVYAKKQLEIYGYSNLIKSYRDPYIVMLDDKKVYRSGVTFEQICSLFILDKSLRNAVMAAMSDLEERLREAAADVIADSFGVNQSDYLQFRNYQNRRTKQKRFSLAEILRTMEKTSQSDKDPIHHYSQKYGNVPPWILFKGIYFGTLVNYISLFKPHEKLMMVQKLYDIENLEHSSE